MYQASERGGAGRATRVEIIVFLSNMQIRDVLVVVTVIIV